MLVLVLFSTQEYTGLEDHCKVIISPWKWHTM